MDTCPNCDNIYGNEPRKIPCGHIVCHKCCMELFNKEDNTLICPVCDKLHTFKSKNIFKKTLQQVAHFGFGKKTSTREVSFASTMPLEKLSSVEKSAAKETNKNTSSRPPTPPSPPTSPTPPPESVVVPSKSPPPPPLLPPPLLPPPVSIGSNKPPVPENIPSRSNKSKPAIIPNKSSTRILPPPLLLALPPPQPLMPNLDAVIARCHSCANKCQVIVCEHCDHFVCLKCAEEHRVITKVDTQDLSNKWQACKIKYDALLQKINQYNRDRTQIESDLAAIRVAVEQRARDAIQLVHDRRDSFITRVNQHVEKEQKLNHIRHAELAGEFRQMDTRLENALNGKDIGSYTQEDFLRDIGQLQMRINDRNDLIETHILEIPTIDRYERVSIEKLLGKLSFKQHMHNGVPNLMGGSSIVNHQNGFLELRSRLPPGLSLPSTKQILPSINDPLSKTLSVDNSLNNTGGDTFDEFRRMAAQIHQQFNAPYSKVLNAATSPPVSTQTPLVSSSETTNTIGEKNSRSSTTTVPAAPGKTLPTNSFTKSWKIDHSAGETFKKISKRFE